MLTNQEESEYQELQKLRKSSTVPLLEEQWDRLNFLYKKYWDKVCTNPKCEPGFRPKVHEDNELATCPNCGDALYSFP